MFTWINSTFLDNVYTSKCSFVVTNNFAYILNFAYIKNHHVVGAYKSCPVGALEWCGGEKIMSTYNIGC